MKKLIRRILALSVAILVVLSFTACKGGKTGKAGKGPLQAENQNSVKVADTMADGVYHVGFNGDSLEKDGDDYYLEVEFYNYDKWNAEDFDKLQVGDEIKTHDTTVKIDTMIPAYEGSTGNKIGYAVNGDIDEGGYSFIRDDNGKTYRAQGYDDAFETYSVGKKKLKVSKDITIEDKSILSGPEEELRDQEIVKYGDIEDELHGSEFGPNNTYMTLKNNEIVKIVVEWTP